MHLANNDIYDMNIYELRMRNESIPKSNLNFFNSKFYFYIIGYFFFWKIKLP